MLEQPVRYIHRTVPVSSTSPPSRDHQQHNIHISSAMVSYEKGQHYVSPVKVEKRKILIKSLVADSLDVIRETSEHSDCTSSSSSHAPMNIQEFSALTSPRNHFENSIRSPVLRHKNLLEFSRPTNTGKHSMESPHNDTIREAVPVNPTRMTTQKALLDTSIINMKTYADVAEDDVERDVTTDTEKTTKGDSSDGGDTKGDSSYGEEGDDENSIGKAPASLANYLKPENVGESSRNLSSSELASFDGDNSAMLFSYDVEENDDGDLSTGKLSLGATHCDDDEELTWRLDPSLSMSDWTVVVVSKVSKLVDRYHVHKNMIAVGKRKSEYFVDIFRQKQKSGSRSTITELVLPDRAAHSIPMLLDYIYSDEGALSLSSETAPGLRYLAQFFGIKVLFEMIMKFIQKDLSLKTLAAYYKGSKDLDDNKILGITARHCARNIHLVDISHTLIQVMDPEFFHRVLSNPALEKEKSSHVSLLIAKYCQLHKDNMNGTTFLNLTSPEYIPQVHHTAALSLLSMEADLVVATSLMSYMTMSSLQERCIKGLASNWRELTELDPARTAQVCRKLPSVVVTELLLKSLDHAKLDNNRHSSTRVLVRREGGVKGKSKDDVAMKKEYQEALDRLKAEYDEKTSHLQQLCYEKDKHIKGYYEELCRYQRLPNTPDGKLVPSGRSNQPTIMPDIGKHCPDGYILTGKKKGSPKYPVFFYKGDSS
jgi:BTB/POZ domain